MKGFSDEPQCSIALLDGGIALRDVIDDHIYQQSLAEEKEAFFMADLGAVMRQHIRWQDQMNQIRPFYPVRCNSSPAVIEVLATLGTGFVCANKSELELVQSFGVPSEDIVFSGMCKQLSHIKHAAKNAVDLLVCDDEAELRKIARAHPRAKLLLQVSTQAASRGEELSMAFGCSLKDCRHLLEEAKELGLQVVGARFCLPGSLADEQAYIHAISDARCVFDMGEDVGFNMKILDIGGGFSGSEAQLKEVHDALTPLLGLYFPPSSDVSLVAEPGAFFVSSAFTLATSVVSKATAPRDRQGHSQGPSPNDEPEFLYCMNDGVYGSFAAKLTETSIAPPSVHKSLFPEEPVYSSSLWGPSGDDMDQVVEHCLLPELSVGDWLLFPSAGAYSLGQLVTGCPDTPTPPVYYVISSGDWFCLHDAGVTNVIAMKNFSLVPYFLNSCHSEAGLSVPA